MGKPLVYVLGNPVEPLDNMALKLIPELEKKFPHIDFIQFDPTEELTVNGNKELMIIDTVTGIKKVIKFGNTNHWILSPRVTAHDYDLPLMLGILKKLGKIKNVMIIGVPQKGSQTEILNDVAEILTSSGI